MSLAFYSFSSNTFCSRLLWQLWQYLQRQSLSQFSGSQTFPIPQPRSPEHSFPMQKIHFHILSRTQTKSFTPVFQKLINDTIHALDFSILLSNTLYASINNSLYKVVTSVNAPVLRRCKGFPHDGTVHRTAMSLLEYFPPRYHVQSTPSLWARSSNCNDNWPLETSTYNSLTGNISQLMHAKILPPGNLFPSNI